MITHPAARLALLILFVVPFAFSACVKDRCNKKVTYSFFVPVYKTKEEVRANIKSNAPRDVQNPGKLYIKGSLIFLNEIDKGIHVIDNSNPAKPRKFAFIDIPGNMDIAVKGNILYADLYNDLVTIDISNPSSVVVKKISENVFPDRNYGGGFVINGAMGIITEWVRKDTTISSECSPNPNFRMDGTVFLASVGSGAASGNASSPIGQGGSMARFTIMNDRLYTVSYSQLRAYNIVNESEPVPTNTTNAGWEIETIYPFMNKLFIGTMTGMLIYDVSNPDSPVPAGTFQHVRSCDPVIADNNYAYVTLRSGSPCLGFTNELDIVQLNNLSNPALIKVYNMKNPHGLAKDGNHLFICDGSDGLKVFDATNVNDLVQLSQVRDIDTYDVITRNGIALVVAKEGLFQYDYSNINSLRLLSKIPVIK